MASIKLGPQARADLTETVDFLREEASTQVAERFAEAAWQTFRWLTTAPNAGRKVEVRRKDAKGIRCWHVEGFEDWLIFYRPTARAIVVFRVLHGARNLPALWRKTRWD